MAIRPSSRLTTTAWESVPVFVRFAVWLWAISIVVGLVVGVVVFGIAALSTMMAVLS